MSERPLGWYIKEIVFCVGGFGVGYMIGTQANGEEQLGEWGWLFCGVLGILAGGLLSRMLEDANN